jgi:hypothetical protein
MTGEEKNRKSEKKNDERIGYDPEDSNPNPRSGVGQQYTAPPF